MGNRQFIITLLTDFGEEDYFAGAMKGVILSINAAATIVDISHEIPPQDIQSGAFNLLNCYKTFPAGTIHVAVVDPGVGSQRKPILIECADHLFVGPDNGLFSWICEREKDWTAVHLTRELFFRQPVSNTFHGRDIFAPVAAHLSKGISPQQFGEPLQDIERLEPLEPTSINENTFEGRIIHVDRFGNCVTNFTADLLLSRGIATSWKMLIKGKEISSFHRFFAEGKPDEIFCVVGSAGFVEICSRHVSAAGLLGLNRGESVQLVSAGLTEFSARSV
jgi:S-adenosylmethionine hydrolase